ESATDWQQLKEVEMFLKDQQVADGELLCYDVSTVPLYLQLGVRPATRFLFPNIQISLFPSRREAIRSELSAGGHRYVVTDLRFFTSSFAPPQLRAARAKVPASSGPDSTAIPPELAQRFPYSEPVVFRTGRYVVHEVRRAEAARPQK